MTYKELKELVPEADAVSRVPSEKMLRESDAVVVAQEIIGNAGGILTVYDNGFVSYITEKNRTVFPLHNCGDIRYEWVSGPDSICSESIFDNEPWHIRLMIEGEDRIAKSKQNSDTGKIFSYSAIAEDYKDMADPGADILEQIIEKELYEELRRLISKTTKKQAEAIARHYLKGQSFTELSAEMGISRQSGTELVERGLDRIRRYLAKQSK